MDHAGGARGGTDVRRRSGRRPPRVGGPRGGQHVVLNEVPDGDDGPTMPVWGTPGTAWGAHTALRLLEGVDAPAMVHHSYLLLPAAANQENIRRLHS